MSVLILQRCDAFRRRAHVESHDNHSTRSCPKSFPKSLSRRSVSRKLRTRLCPPAPGRMDRGGELTSRGSSSGIFQRKSSGAEFRHRGANHVPIFGRKEIGSPPARGRGNVIQQPVFAFPILLRIFYRTTF